MVTLGNYAKTPLRNSTVRLRCDIAHEGNAGYRINQSYVSLADSRYSLDDITFRLGQCVEGWGMCHCIAVTDLSIQAAIWDFDNTRQSHSISGR